MNLAALALALPRPTLLFIVPMAEALGIDDAIASLLAAFRLGFPPKSDTSWFALLHGYPLSCVKCSWFQMQHAHLPARNELAHSLTALTEASLTLIFP